VRPNPSAGGQKPKLMSSKWQPKRSHSTEKQGVRLVAVLAT
jgi:hypothetical protein